MTTKKVWHVKYVVGNPRIYTKVTTSAGGPYLRRHALFYMSDCICKDWRCWVEHSITGEVIARNDTERAWQAGEIEAA
jgi:hypothetical protein